MIYPPVQYYCDLSTLKGDAFLAEVNKIRLAYDRKSSMVVRVGGGYGINASGNHVWQAWKNKAEVIRMTQDALNATQEKHDTDAVEWIERRTPHNVKMFSLVDRNISADLLAALSRMPRRVRMFALAFGHLTDAEFETMWQS